MASSSLCIGLTGLLLQFEIGMVQIVILPNSDLGSWLLGIEMSTHMMVTFFCHGETVSYLLHDIGPFESHMLLGENLMVRQTL